MNPFKALFNSKSLWIAITFFIFYFDLAFTIFAVSGGLKDGRIYWEDNDFIKNAIHTGNIHIVLAFAVITSAIIGIQSWLFGKHWIWRIICWGMTFFRIYLFLMTLRIL